MCYVVPLCTTHHPGIFFLPQQYLKTTVLYLANGYGTSSRKEQAHESGKSVYTIKGEVKGGLLRSFFLSTIAFRIKCMSWKANYKNTLFVKIILLP